MVYLRFFLVLFAFAIGLVLAEADYYKILGISRDADEKEVKKAYRALSKKYHPDKNPGDEEAHERFIEVGEAYDVLADEEKRSLYDRYGEAGVKNGGSGQQHQGHNPFEMFFGHQFHQQQQRGKPRGQDISTSMTISLKDFYNGVAKDFNVEMQDICDDCDGSGSKDGKTHTCSACNGMGIRIVKSQIAPGMIQQFQTTCDKCGGKGKVIANACKKCHGDGVFRNRRSHSVHVAPGTPRDFVEVLKGEADHSPDWIAGDLRVSLKEDKSGNFGYVRVGSNLYRKEILSLKEAIHGGWSRQIPFLDNYDPHITIKREKGHVVQNGEVERVVKKGMPIFNNEDEYGDLFIEYQVILPSTSNSKDEL